MKVIEHLQNANRTLISFEIIPPRRGGNVKELLSVIDELVKYNPPFIDITSHAAEVKYKETPSGDMNMKITRRRPGTLGLCALIQYKYNVDAVPHILCSGFTREETEDFLIELHYLKIENLLAIRGDDAAYKKPLKYGRSSNDYASDLVRQIEELNRGKYLEDSLLDPQPMNFCIGVAGYPEKHFEAPNLQTDIRFTKNKIESGADYIVTQMFFSNNSFYNYVEACRAEGIQVPIIPGLKILTSKNQISSIPKNFFIDIPQDFAGEIMEAKPEHVMEIGVNWTLKQVEDLLNKNVPAIHFYVMQNSKPITMLMKKLKL